MSYLKKYETGIKNLKDDILQLQKSGVKNVDYIINYLCCSFEYCWKQYDWNYEQEYRAVSIVSKSFNNKLKFEKKSIDEIYIGFRMKKDNAEYYRNLLHILKYEYSHVKTFIVKPDTSLVRLNFERVQISES